MKLPGDSVGGAPEPSPSGTGTTSVSFTLDKSYPTQRALTLMAETFSRPNWIRATTIQAFVGAVIGLLAFLYLGAWGAVLGIVFWTTAFVIVIFQPALYFIKWRRLDGRAVPVGSKINAVYYPEHFSVENPSGAIRVYKYGEMRDVHPRGPFVLFNLLKFTYVVILPLGLLPGGDRRWLEDRVREASAEA
jgi:hypothetical protein